MACASIVLWLFFTIYLLRLDDVVGMVQDDAWYVLLAKALATGEGYTMINSPTGGIRPITPPGFPALLALFWLIWPDFPANLWLLKSVSIAAMLGVGLVVFFYFKNDRELPPFLALAISAATILYPALVFHATGMVMSECVFMLFQFAAIVAIGRSRQSNSTAPWRYAALGGLLASLAILTRSAGIGLIAGSLLYLLKERCGRQALIVGTVVVLLAGSWFGYARAHAPTLEQRAEQASSIVQPYHEQFWQRLAGSRTTGTITVGELPDRVWTNLVEISRIDMGAVALYPFYRALVPGEKVFLSRPAVWLSLALTVLAIIGLVTTARQRLSPAEFVVPLSLAVSVLWSWEQFRFLLPLIPFLIFYQLMGVRVVFQLGQRFLAKPAPAAMWITLTVLVWFMVGLNIYSNARFIERQHRPSPGNKLLWYSTFEENAAIFRVVSEQLPKDAVLATQNPALLHLFTGHKTVALGDPSLSSEVWNRVGVRYLVYASPNPMPKTDEAEGRYRTVYRQSGRLGLRVVDLGPPESRQIWAK